ncbi:MAG: FAD-binding oxidoreductase [Vicinamibacterales bacterium]
MAALTAALLIYPLRRAAHYAEDPTGPHDCEPIEPAVSADKATRLQIAPAADLSWAQIGGTINDVSCLDRTPIYGIVQIRTPDDVRRALQFAKANGLKVSAAGVRHSMGGQALARGGIVLDMTLFKRLSLNEADRILTAESGATWHDIQNYLHPRFAVKSMQSTDIFSVGGSISVNAHGMDHQAGSVGRTIRSMRVMLADGSIRSVSRTEEPRLFSLVVGGYGLFGVILDVDLEITENVVYRSERRVIDYQEFADLFESRIKPDTSVGLMYGHLSTSPGSLLREMIVYAYRQVDLQDAVIPPLGEVSQVKLRRLVFNLSRQGDLAMRVKWLVEKHIEPRLESCTVTRNQAMGEAEACLVSRNDPMHDSVPYLRHALNNVTDILHEYFVPQSGFVAFVDGMRGILGDGRTTLLNASVRIVHREDNFLSYAPSDNRLAVVLYLGQSTNSQGNERMRQVTRELIDLCARVGGRFFLPYQLHYTAEQLVRSYPETGAFFEAKREIDPDGLFTNTFYEKYGRTPQ